MNIQNDISDENLNPNDMARLEEELSIVTDSHRTVAQMNGLSPKAQTQAQTFDLYAELLKQAVPLKPVQWTVPIPKSVSMSSQKSIRSIFNRVTTVALSLAVLVAIILCNQWDFITQNGSSVNTYTQNTEDESNDSLSIYNYWGDSFENQLSDFEGEMVCMSVASNDVVPMDSSYLDDFSDSGDF